MTNKRTTADKDVRYKALRPFAKTYSKFRKQKLEVMIYLIKGAVLLVAVLFFVILQPSHFTTSSSCNYHPKVHKIFQKFANHEVFYLDGNNGSDSSTGTQLKDGGSGKGPFKTFEKALANIMLQKKSKVVLYVRSGVYEFSQPINLKSRKSSGISIVGYPKDPIRPIISGGQRIPRSTFVQYHQVGQNTMYAAYYDGKCSQHAFLGSSRLFRARKPNLKKWTGQNLSGEGDYLTMANLLVSTPDCNIQGTGGFKQDNCPDRNKNGFQFKAGDINPHWHKITEIDILIFQAWTAERAPVAQVLEQNNTVLFQRPARYPIGRHPRPSGWRYIIENVFEELDAVGEFYCDEQHKLFIFIPPTDTQLNDDIYVGQSTSLFALKNVNDIYFDNLEFRYTHDAYFSGFYNKPAAISIELCNGISVENCAFSNMGYTGIYTQSSINLNFEYNTFTDIGNLAIAVDYNKEQTPQTRDVLVNRNTFSGCGVTHMLQPCCVHVRGMKNIKVQNNDISNVPYAGIRVGWQPLFSYGYRGPNEYVFEISQNNIHDYGRGILNDFGGIYLSSSITACGTTKDLSKCHIHALIERNTIHTSSSYQYGAIGIYGDTAASSITVRDNWIFNLEDCSINFHCGINNMASNNMIDHINPHRVFGTCNSLVGGSGGAPTQSANFSKNVIVIEDPSAHLFRKSDFWDNNVPTVDYNVYYFTPKQHLQLDDFWPVYVSLNDWRKRTGNDVNSVISNPRFASLKGSIYKLNIKNSPAFALGIKSIDLTSVLRRSGACYV